MRKKIQTNEIGHVLGCKCVVCRNSNWLTTNISEARRLANEAYRDGYDILGPSPEYWEGFAAALVKLRARINRHAAKTPEDQDARYKQLLQISAEVGGIRWLVGDGSAWATCRTHDVVLYEVKALLEGKAEVITIERKEPPTVRMSDGAK